MFVADEKTKTTIFQLQIANCDVNTFYFAFSFCGYIADKDKYGSIVPVLHSTNVRSCNSVSICAGSSIRPTPSVCTVSVAC